MGLTLDAKIKEIEAQFRAGDPGALPQASKLIEKYPNEMGAWMLRAYIHGIQRNYNKAIDDLTHAIDISPTEPCLFFDRGRYYLRSSDYQNAIDDFTNGLAACDLHSSDYYRETLHFFRADMYLKLGNKKAACEDLKNVQDGFDIWTDRFCSKQELLAQCTTDE